MLAMLGVLIMCLAADTLAFTKTDSADEPDDFPKPSHDDRFDQESHDDALHGRGGYIHDGASHDAAWEGDGDDSLWSDDGKDMPHGDNDDWLPGTEGHAAGGADYDQFFMQEWMNTGSVAHINDYHPAHDQLVVAYDASVHTDPVLSVKQNATGGGQSVFIDGSRVAVVHGADVRLEDIRLSPM